VTVFDGLHPALKALLSEFGFEEPTEPQQAAIPIITAGHHLLLVAPTGIGKTEAAMLPIISWILHARPPGVAVLYITPLRALNRDMLRRLTALGERLDITVGVRHADTTPAERQRLSKDPPQILITTPETLQIMLQGKRLREGLRNVRKVVVDEIHELAASERGAQLSVALERLSAQVAFGNGPKEGEPIHDFQRIGLSATVGSPEVVAQFLGGVGRKMEIAVVKVPKGLKIEVVRPPGREPKGREVDLGITPDILGALDKCRSIIDAHHSTLLFVNTRDSAEFLASRTLMLDDQYPITVHHGSLSKEVRIKAEEDFRAQRVKALVCTSSLELGIDIGSADHTIQFNSPRQVTRLVQRVGRAGHGIGRTSEGTIVALNPDDIAESLVIARRAMASEIETMSIRPAPLTVLANQVIAMTLERKMDKDEVFNIVTATVPFKHLAREEFERVLQQLHSLYRVWVRDEDGGLGRKKRGFSYFYDNISMIADERTYLIRDITTRGIVGTLDENFVVTYMSEGARFIVKGRPWHLVEISDDEVLVEPSGLEGAIPHWVGEEIPVPYEVAQEVGRLRARLDKTAYPCDDATFTRFSDFIKDHAKTHPVPDDRTLLIEVSDRVAIIHGCFGSKVNETLGRVISSLLSARYGASVGMRSDPYRVVLDLPTTPRADDLVTLIKSIDPRGLEELLRIVLRNSSLIRWSLLYTARKFGALDRDVDLKFLNIQRLIRSFEHTPLIDETLSKLIWERMDIEITAKVLSDLHTGGIAIRTTKGKPSPLGLLGLEASREFMAPAHADRQILHALRRRLEKEYVRLACFGCDGSVRKQIAALTERIECPLCGGKMVAVIHARDDSHELLKKRRHKDLSPNELKTLARMKKNANVIMTNGKRAALVLAGRGVGPDTAIKILSKPYDSDEEFLRAILAAEVNYARTKRFWD
jgi:ATP-dependent helicase Lhr and Lhr-like helicase